MHERSRVLAAITALCLAAAPAAADTLDAVRQRGSIIWGGDQEGGGPYVYPQPDNPGKLTGFEVELMDLLAARLGVRPEFKQAEWTSLPSLLHTGDIDVVLNGYELTPGNLDKMTATIPYYVYELQLLTRKDDRSIQSWDDLASAGAGRTVAVLDGSAADRYVRTRLGHRVNVVSYPGATQCFAKVRDGAHDATVQDLPAALFYRNRYPTLGFVGPPVAPGYYVIYMRKGDERLRDELNRALLELIRGGQLRTLYEKYGLWNPAQEKLGTPGLGGEVRQSTEAHGWGVVQRNLPLLLKAAGMTVFLSCAAMPLAIGLGLVVALGRLYGPGPLRWLLTVYVEGVRGTPIILQLYTIFFVLPPAFGWDLQPIPAAIIGLAINYSAYEAEIYRAGLLAIPAGQMEAALALGMTRLTALRRVVVPQAVRLVVPPVTNDFIALFKDTSICSVIGVMELNKQYQILVNNYNAFLELATVTAVLYLLMSYPLSLLARRLERRMPRLAY